MGDLGPSSSNTGQSRAHPPSFQQLLEEAAEIADVELGQISSAGEKFRTFYDFWVVNGGDIKGKPRRSVRQIKEWLGTNRQVRSLETKLAGKTFLQRGDIENLLSLFVEHWHHDTSTDSETPYPTKNRPLFVKHLVDDLLKDDGDRLRLPLRRRNGTPTERHQASSRPAQLPQEGTRSTREALIEHYREGDALMTVSRERTFTGTDPGSIMAGFQNLMDTFRAVDDEDDRFRVLIWIVDLGRREGDPHAQLALHNLDFVATQFRSFLMTRHKEKNERRRWFTSRAAVLVGTMPPDEIDRTYEKADLRPATPDAPERSWLTADRLLFEGVPRRWVSTMAGLPSADEADDGLGQQSITVHYDRQSRKTETEIAGGIGDLVYLLHRTEPMPDGAMAIRCITLPTLGVRWNDSFRLAYYAARLRLNRELKPKTPFPFTSSECLALLRRQNYGVLTATEFCQLTNRLAFES